MYLSTEEFVCRENRNSLYRNIGLKTEMCDLRDARQKYTCRKLEELVQVLAQLDDEDDTTDLVKLCRKVELSQEKLKLHHRYADHFRGA